MMHVFNELPGYDIVRDGEKYRIVFDGFENREQAKEWLKTLHSVPKASTWQRHKMEMPSEDDIKETFYNGSYKVFWDGEIGLHVLTKDENGQNKRHKINP